MANQKNADIKKGDLVRVIAGKDKGARGQGHRGPTRRRQGHRRGRQPRQEAHQGVNQAQRGGTTGGIVTQEAPIHVSNVMLLVDARTQRQARSPPASATAATRCTKRRPDGSTYTGHRSVRVAASTGEEI